MDVEWRTVVKYCSFLFNYLQRNNVMIYYLYEIKHCYVGGVICNVYI